MPPIKEVTNSAEAKEIMPQVNRFYNSLEDFKVNTAGSWLEAGEKIKFAKAKIKEIRAVRKEFLDPINELKETTLGFFEPALSKLERIVEILGKKMADWRNEQLEKERIAQEKVDAEAREKERIERERLRKEAEARETAARKAQEEAEEARKRADALARKENFEKSERARLEAEEKEREALALKEEAKEIKQESKEVEVEAKEVRSKAEKINGLHFRRYWKARIIDVNKIPRAFLKPDEVAINEYVSKNKGDSFIPGVEVYFEDKPIG
jgi:flagellar biosynthesis GTPase FlhF